MRKDRALQVGNRVFPGPSDELVPVAALMLRLLRGPRESIVIDPFKRMQGYIAMTHESLAQQVDAVVKVLPLLRDRIRVLVVVGVVGFADVVDAVEGMVDIQSDKVAALFVV